MNSISANLITPQIENFLDGNTKSDREKINEIKKIPSTLEGLDTDDLRFITGNNVRLREESSTNSKIIDELVIGQVVTVLSKEKNWIEIIYEYDNGEEFSGWVFTRYVVNFKK